MDKPSQKLSQKIIERLIQEKLLLLRHIILQNEKGCDIHPSWKQRTYFSV